MIATADVRAPQQSQPQPDSAQLEEQIRRRAHEIWLARGEQAGSDIDDWLKAEAEILAARENP
jgi:Protein of unknown function (DUF2934)